MRISLAKIVVCGAFGIFERGCYEPVFVASLSGLLPHLPEGMVKESPKVLWDLQIQTASMGADNQPDIEMSQQ